MIKLRCLLTFILVLLLSGCGFHLQHDTSIPQQFQTMTLSSVDPYGQLSREIRNVMNDNKVKLVDQDSQGEYPSLRVISSGLTRDTISIYQDGKSAEYQLILTVDAQIVIKNDNIHPLTVKVFRTFFDNPATALAKSTEQVLIEKEMYNQAAKQLVGKLKSIDTANQKTNTQ